MCKKDLRYTKQLLHDIINEAVDLDGCSRETAEMLQNKVNRIPSGASYAKNAIRILYDVDM